MFNLFVRQRDFLKQAVVVKDGKKIPRELERWTLADEILENVKTKVVKGVRDEAKSFHKHKTPKKDYDFEVSGKKWANKVIDVLGKVVGDICETRGDGRREQDEGEGTENGV